MDRGNACNFATLAGSRPTVHDEGMDTRQFIALFGQFTCLTISRLPTLWSICFTKANITASSQVAQAAKEDVRKRRDQSLVYPVALDKEQLTEKPSAPAVSLIADSSFAPSLLMACTRR
jgi:hypothetical protein